MASWHDIGEAAPRPAGADLSAKQYYIVKLDGSANYVLASAATDKLSGVLMNKPESGETALVYSRGKAPVIAGGNIAIGDRLTSDGSGKAIATTTEDNIVLGEALQAASANEIFEAQINITHVP